jgi:shikimate kinase
MPVKNIFLVGMPSSGKSTLGRKLARLLNYEFVDMDKLIVDDQGMTIPAIFSSKGEDHFREVESRILKTLLPDQSYVVATGGGVPCFFDNMDYIKANGLSIFLDIPPHILAERIENHGKDDRPLLSGLTELEEELTKKYEYRLPFYSRADLTIPGELSVHKLLELLTPLLEN